MALGPSRHMRDSHFPKVGFFCQLDLAIFSTHLPSFRRRCSRKARVLQCWWMPPLAVEGIPGAPSQKTPQWVLQIVREIQKEDLCWGLFAVWNTEGMLFDPFFVAILSWLLSACRRLLEVAEATVACLGVKFPLRRWTPCPKSTSSQGFRPRCGSNSHFRGRGRAFYHLFSATLGLSNGIHGLWQATTSRWDALLRAMKYYVSMFPWWKNYPVQMVQTLVNSQEVFTIWENQLVHYSLGTLKYLERERYLRGVMIGSCSTLITWLPED